MLANLKLGYWSVGRQIFTNKAQALLAATESKIPIQYHFNDTEYSAHDWGQCPIQGLPELYRQRAQQIRDRYDHVVAFFSAGSDSTNMVESFLLNDIPLDEVLTYGSWNHRVDKNSAPNAEFQNSGHPLIQRCIKAGTKFTHHNFLDHFSHIYQDDDWIWRSGSVLAGYAGFWETLYDLPHIRKLVDQGQRVCFLRGVDKPKIFMDRYHYWIHFTDLYFSETAIHSAYYGNGIDTVWFYTDPDCVDLTTKQCHVFLDHLERTMSLTEIRNLLLTAVNIDRVLAIQNQILYAETWNQENFTLGKFHIMDPGKWRWFTRGMTDTDQHRRYHGVLEEFNRNINPAFLNQLHGYQKFYTRYAIRPVSAH